MPSPRASSGPVPPLVHLHVHSGFSRLEGASAPEALAARAAALGMPALALTDRDTLSGAVSFLQACARHGLQAILGAEVTLESGGLGGGEGLAAPPRLILLAPGPGGYAALCRLLSRAHLDHPRGQPRVTVPSLAEEAGHLLALSGGRCGEIAAHILGRRPAMALSAAAAYADLFGRDRFYLELPADRLPGNARLHRDLRALGGHLGLRTLATADVHYATPERAWVSDLLTCVRLRCRLEDLPAERAPGAFNAERHLKSAAEVLEAVGDPGDVARSAEVAARCAPALALGVNRYPRFPLAGLPAEAELRRQVEDGARWRHGPHPRAEVRERLAHELDIIGRLGFCDYFLCVADLARWARAQGIRVAGRGSAADSAVAYVLGITDVDAAGRGHLFERFLSEERAEAPDIDLDFDARQRDRVAEYVVGRYGQGRVCAVGAHNTWCARSAVRELGRALGFPPGELDALSRRIPYYVEAERLRAALQAVPELRALPGARGRLAALATAVGAVSGLPRHHATHTGGLCIAPGRLTDLMPLQRAAKGVVVSQWDKRDVEAAGLLKLDLLSLRTLGAVEDAVRLAPGVGGAVDYERIPEDDRATFARLRRGETVGVFQLESAAQIALQQRLGADRLEDVIASVALVRPGPIQGEMVEPFLRRRLGREAVTFPAPGLESILGRTHGVVIYQEQVIAIATAVAGFSPGEADRLRRVMSHARSPREMEELGGLFVERAKARGMAPEAAGAIFRCLQGYASYGFPEAHAVAFGHTAYRTAYLAEHRPAAYFAGLLNNQPMGFYPVGTLVNELRRRGVAVLGPSVQRSGAAWGQGPDVGARRLRAPLWAVRGVGAPLAGAVVAAREEGGAFRSVADLAARVPALPRDALDALVLSGACDPLAEDGNRWRLLWSLGAVVEGARAGGLGLVEAPPALADFTPREKWRTEVVLLGWSPRGHVMALAREELRLQERGYLRTGQVRCAPDGQALSLAGVPVRPHRPPTKSGKRLVFLGLEDEEGLVEVLVPEEVYLRDAAALFPAAPLLGVDGRVRRRGSGAGVVAARVRALP